MDWGGGDRQQIGWSISHCERESKLWMFSVWNINIVGQKKAFYFFFLIYFIIYSGRKEGERKTV